MESFKLKYTFDKGSVLSYMDREFGEYIRKLSKEQSQEQMDLFYVMDFELAVKEMIREGIKTKMLEIEKVKANLTHSKEGKYHNIFIEPVQIADPAGKSGFMESFELKYTFYKERTKTQWDRKYLGPLSEKQRQLFLELDFDSAVEEMIGKGIKTKMLGKDKVKMRLTYSQKGRYHKIFVEPIKMADPWGEKEFLESFEHKYTVHKGRIMPLWDKKYVEQLCGKQGYLFSEKYFDLAIEEMIEKGIKTKMIKRDEIKVKLTHFKEGKNHKIFVEPIQMADPSGKKGLMESFKLKYTAYEGLPTTCWHRKYIEPLSEKQRHLFSQPYFELAIEKMIRNGIKAKKLERSQITLRLTHSKRGKYHTVFVESLQITNHKGEKS